MTNVANAYLSICAPIDCGTKEAAEKLADWIAYYNMRIHTTSATRPDGFPQFPTDDEIEKDGRPVMIKWNGESPVVTLTSVDNYTHLEGICDLIQALMLVTPEMPQAQGIQYARWMLTPSPDIYGGGYVLIYPDIPPVHNTTFDLMQNELEHVHRSSGKSQ